MFTFLYLITNYNVILVRTESKLNKSYINWSVIQIECVLFTTCLLHNNIIKQYAAIHTHIAWSFAGTLIIPKNTNLYVRMLIINIKREIESEREKKKQKFSSFFSSLPS